MSGVLNVLERCGRCDTQLAPGMLACPLCGTLVHGSELKALAATAERHEAGGALVEARATWERALALLPRTARQHEVISGRVAELTARINSVAGARGRLAGATGQPWWRRGLAAVGVVLLFALGKLKFLLLGLTKAGTLVSMFAFFGVAWTQFGWALAAGVVVSIYIHEMGHVAAVRKLGIAAGAPLFIPGLGALVLLKQRIEDPSSDARVGLAGPLWGLGASLAAVALYYATRAPLWLATAKISAVINLFNLIPLWQLDGARGFHPLARWQRWTVVAALAVAFLVTSQGVLLVVAAISAFMALQPAAGEPDSRALAIWMVLIVGLSALAAIPVRIS